MRCATVRGSRTNPIYPVRTCSLWLLWSHLYDSLPVSHLLSHFISLVISIPHPLLLPHTTIRPSVTYAPFVSSALPPQAPLLLLLLLTLQTFLSFPTSLLISLVALHFPKPSLAALSNKYERAIPPVTPNCGAPPPLFACLSCKTPRPSVTSANVAARMPRP